MTFSNKSVAIEQDSSEAEPKEVGISPNEEIKENKEVEVTPPEEPKEEKEIEEQPIVSETAGDGFFDDFVSTNQEEENQRGRGDR